MAKHNKQCSLGTYTARQVGDSLIITVPATAGVTAGTRFELTVNGNGDLTYHRVKSNPWTDGTYANIDFDELRKTYGTVDDTPVGKERLDKY